MEIIRNGFVFSTDEGFAKKDLLINEGKIVEIGENISDNGALCIDAENLYVVPGFIDMHTHGAFGYDLATASCEDIDKISVFYANKGVTAFVPTTITLSVVNIVKTLENISRRIEMGTSGARILGINLEGPFINRKFKGAHPEEYIMHPTVELIESFVKKSNDNIRIITIAPELDGVYDIINYFKNRRIVFAIGHSALDSNGAQEAFEHGITHVTHLFNAMPGIHHREPALPGAALGNDNVTVEIIADGIHINPAIIRMVAKCKPSGKVVLVTDSSMAAGLDDGEYFLGEQKIVVKNREARLASGVLSGSTLSMIDAVQNMIKKFGIPLEETIKMVSDTPSKIIKVDDVKGSLLPGKDADIVLLDGDLNIKMTIVEGRTVFKK